MPNLFAQTDGLYAFSPEEVDAIYMAGRQVTYAAGDVIIQRNRPGDCMFILLEGAVELDLGFEGKLVLDQPGDYFGELSFLHPGHPRSASVRAVTNTRVCALDQDVIELLYRRYPRALLTLFRRASAFLIDSREQLLANLIDQNEALTRSYDYLQRTHEALNYQELLAQTDELTQLFNRRCLMQQLCRAVDESRETSRRVGLLMLDLDGFKPVNDLYGHPAGDYLLRQVAGVIRDCIRTDDLPCRYGGDEFAILLRDVERMPARVRAEEIRESIEGLPPIRPGAPQVSASIGGTLYRDGDTADTLLARADAYLYQAKSNGRNRVVWSL
jgi:diguanylate cyclase (GGDEF)-like protein